MKKHIKIITIVLAVVMILGVCSTAFAWEDGLPNQDWGGGYFPTCQSGSNNNAVRLIQHYYNTRFYGSLAMDGVFGNNTYQGVLAIQRNVGAAADGIVGSNTWTRMEWYTAITMQKYIFPNNYYYIGTNRYDTGTYYDSQACHYGNGTWAAIVNGNFFTIR